MFSMSMPRPTASVWTRAASVVLLALLSVFEVNAAPPGCPSYECFSQPDHPAIRACLTRESEASSIRLKQAEDAVLSRIRASDIDSEYRDGLIQAATTTMRSYRTFRDDQCAFAWATAQGGNSAQDKQLACLACLDDMQTALWNSYPVDARPRP